MKTILRFLGYVLRALCALAFGVVAMYAALVIFTSGYEYRLVEEKKVMRAWHVELPGYEPYLDLKSKPLVYRHRFVMRMPYRVGPWIEPEFPNDENHYATP